MENKNEKILEIITFVITIYVGLQDIKINMNQYINWIFVAFILELLLILVVKNYSIKNFSYVKYKILVIFIYYLGYYLCFQFIILQNKNSDNYKIIYNFFFIYFIIFQTTVPIYLLVIKIFKSNKLKKIRIALTNFEPDEEQQILSNSLLKKLNERKYENIEFFSIKHIDEIHGGEKKILEIGKKYQYDYIIWGADEKRLENERITINFLKIRSNQKLKNFEKIFYSQIKSNSFNFISDIISESITLIDFISALAISESIFINHLDYKDQKNYDLYNLAISLYTQIIKKEKTILNFTNLEIIYSERAKVFWRMGMYNESILDLSKAITYSITKERLLDRSLYYYKLGNLKKAHDDVNAFINLYPNIAEAYIIKGVINHKLGENDLALKNYLLAKEKNFLTDYNKKINKTIFFERTAIKIKDFVERKKFLDFDDIFNKNDNSEILMNKVHRNYLLLNYKKALFYSYILIYEKYKLGLTYHMQGLIFKRINNYKKAIESFKLSYKYSKNPIELTSIGRCYAIIGELVEAEKYYIRANKTLKSNKNIDKKIKKQLKRELKLLNFFIKLKN